MTWERYARELDEIHNNQDIKDSGECIKDNRLPCNNCGGCFIDRED